LALALKVAERQMGTLEEDKAALQPQYSLLEVVPSESEEQFWWRVDVFFEAMHVLYVSEPVGVEHCVNSG
jgi:hypothetical protein